MAALSHGSRRSDSGTSGIHARRLRDDLRRQHGEHGSGDNRCDVRMYVVEENWMSMCLHFASFSFGADFVVTLLVAPNWRSPAKKQAEIEKHSRSWFLLFNKVQAPQGAKSQVVDEPQMMGKQIRLGDVVCCER